MDCIVTDLQHTARCKGIKVIAHSNEIFSHLHWENKNKSKDIGYPLLLNNPESSLTEVCYQVDLTKLLTRKIKHKRQFQNCCFAIPETKHQNYIKNFRLKRAFQQYNTVLEHFGSSNSIAF